VSHLPAPGAWTVRLSGGDEILVEREAVRMGGKEAGHIEIERPTDPGDLVQGWCRQADPTLHVPYWAELWPASRAIARLLISGESLAGKSVLDLGCGLGLSGIAAGLRGARVLFADQDSDALVFARRNADRAGIRNAAFVAMDWRAPVWSRSFDLVLGADVIYDRIDHEPVTMLLESLLTGGGKALLGDPCRSDADRFLSEWNLRHRGGTRTIYRGSFPGEDLEVAVHELRLA
jgi:2-polyprenyl-3-methyl-5-hydroxy-6-metoxy-1,4-benzoquinol methylase